MSSIGSKIARQGSAASSTAGVDQSSHNHFFSRLRATPQPSWLHEVWLGHNQRSDRISVGATMGMAVLTREMMEMHIQRAPDVRGMLDCLPVADRSNTNPAAAFIGWRQKLGTWPHPKQYPAATGTQRRF